MLHINYFGITLVVDKTTNLILYSTRSNETAKFVVSSILDTAVIQQGDYITKNIDKEWFTEKYWIRHDSGGKFTQYIDSVPTDVVKKREIAIRRARGYYLLLEQATIIGTSYDNLSDLSTDDLPMYLLNKEQYIREYAQSKGMSLDIAEKQLTFLAESLISVYFRKQTLIWKYGTSLKTIETEQEFIDWKNNVIRETVGLGQV